MILFLKMKYNTIWLKFQKETSQPLSLVVAKNIKSCSHKILKHLFKRRNYASIWTKYSMHDNNIKEYKFWSQSL